MTTKTPSFIERLEASGIGQQLLTEEAAAVLARRGKLVSEKERLIATLETELPARALAEQKAQAKLERLQEAFKVARFEYADAVNATMGLTQRHDYLVSQIDAELVASASPLIAEFIETLRTMIENIGNTPLGVEPDFPKGLKVGQPLPEDILAIQTALQGRDDRLGKITAIIPVVESLKKAAVSDGELVKKLATFSRLVGVVGK